MSDETQPVEAPVAPVVPEKTPEQLRNEAETAAIKARQELVKTAIKGLIQTLFDDPAEFTVDELGWASDAFKQWLQIRTTATKEHEAFSKTNEAAQEQFYSLKVKDLTSILDEKITETIQSESSPVGV